ncbi:MULTISPECIES: hypothetical protein [Chryseobacterium]|uniref:Uncharacterized protein n=1 Tax=Chryseobacterium gallinarum TaxID=1324352 RepID=A0ABX6KMF9_CHRGL|nr:MULTISPECIES: hypothetical protein [Chryseobacterium]MCL8538191.1 hypothetical protein [Chryseobacterium gallinarum]QIY89837.1 hypothetical protein FOB44_03825 [Chryseobacterium gallinarum]
MKTRKTLKFSKETVVLLDNAVDQRGAFQPVGETRSCYKICSVYAVHGSIACK